MAVIMSKEITTPGSSSGGGAVSGTPASYFEVGSSVYLKVNGTLREFIVVHQGNPDTSIYDNSCDGTWLLMNDIYIDNQWHPYNAGSNSYVKSTAHSYLTETFLGLLDTSVQSVIKEVKIPYLNGTSSGGSLASGANGLTTKVFLLGGYEIGWQDSSWGNWIPKDGACLSYFNVNSASDAKRIAYLNGTAKEWWTRSAYNDVNNTGMVWFVKPDGSIHYGYTSQAYGIRPAIIIQSNALFDPSTKEFIGVEDDIPSGGESGVSGIRASDLEEGNTVLVNENGANVEFYIAKHDYESGLNGPGRTLLVRKVCYDEYYWHTTSYAAYASSNIDAWLNGTYKEMLDENLQNAIASTTFYYTPTPGTSTVSTLTRDVFLLSVTELEVSDHYYWHNVEGSLLPTASILWTIDQWTRSPSNNSSYPGRAYNVQTTSSAAKGNDVSLNQVGRRPSFTIPSNALFDPTTMEFLGVM